jgi:hypothetical protein
MMKTTTCENIMNNSDFLEPCKEIETMEMLEIPKFPEYWENIFYCKLMYDR